MRKTQRMAKYQLYHPKSEAKGRQRIYTWLELDRWDTASNDVEKNDERESLPDGSRASIARQSDVHSVPTGRTCYYPIEFDGRSISARTRTNRKTHREGIKRLRAAQTARCGAAKVVYYVRSSMTFRLSPITTFGDDTRPRRVREESMSSKRRRRSVERCLLMTTDPGDLVLDPTCGSGTTAYVAEQWGRRWITTDTSRVAITLAKQRLMTATFDYYTLAHPEQGVGSGFVYKTVPHVTLKSIANNPEIKEGMTREQIDTAIAKYADTETLYDQPDVDKRKARVTGPFTVEAVPAATVRAP